MNKKYFLVAAVLSVFFLSMVAQPTLVYAETEYVDVNFKVNLYVQTGSRTRNSMALYVKQALAPLGIDVNIITLPWGQYVGFLLGYYVGQDWDMAIVAFNEGAPTPSPKLQYTPGAWANRLHNLDTPGLAEWMLEDTGLNMTTDVYDLAFEIHNEFNITHRVELAQQWNDLYFDKLMFNLPMVSPNGVESMWRGFGGPNNEGWDNLEGVFGSSAMGAKWESNPATRAEHTNASTYRLDIGTISSENLDAGQIFDSEGFQLIGPLSDSTVFTDQNNVLHPGLAWNVIFGDFGDEKMVDHDNDPSTPDQLMNVSRTTIFLRDDIYFEATTGYDGTVYPRTLATAYDVLLPLQLYDWSRIGGWGFNGEDEFDTFVGYEINSTLRPADTITLFTDTSQHTVDSLYDWAGWGVMPSYILGNESSLLHFTQKNGTVFTAPLAWDMVDNGWDPRDSDEFDQYETYDGFTDVGQYDLVAHKHNEFYSYKERDDYYYPNQWDTPTYYGDGSKFTAWEALLSGVDFSKWGGGLDDATFAQTPRYFAYADDASTTTVKEKPTASTLPYVEYVTIDETTDRALAFEAGTIDRFASSTLSHETAQNHEANPDMVVKSWEDVGGAETLYINVGHSHLKKHVVRKAISNALDRKVIIDGIEDGYGIEWWSSLQAGHKTFGVDWNTVQSPQDISYENARDLMRSLGYDAAESNEAAPKTDIPAPDEIFVAIGITDTGVGNPFLVFLSSAAIFSIVVIRKRRN